MSEQLKEFLRNKSGQPILSACVTISQRDFDNDKRKYTDGVQRSLLQQVLEGKNLNELSVDGNKQLVNDIKKEFHVETFMEGGNVYVKAWMPEITVDVSKYPKRVKKTKNFCPSCGNSVDGNWKFCPSCGEGFGVTVK